MDHTRTRVMEDLLRLAIPGVTARRGANEVMSLENYRNHLLATRAKYDPVLRLYTSLFKPEIEDADIRKKILGLIRDELEPHTREGRILSATYAVMGEPFEGTPIEVILTNLLKRAIVGGAEGAAKAFAECTLNASYTYYDYRLLVGLKVNDEVEIVDGVQLIPLPDKIEQLPVFLPVIFGQGVGDLRAEHFLSRTMLRLEREISPVFHRPAEENPVESWPGSHFNITLKSKGDPDFNPDTFCQALSLTSSYNIRPAVSWTVFNPYEIFDLTDFMGGWNWYSQDIHERNSGTLSNSDLKEAIRTHKALAELPQKTKDALRVPIDRWRKSTGQRDPADRVIDLGVALESLYLSDNDYRNELRFRLALRASWHLGKDQSQRSSLMKEFRTIYDWRSRAVHTGSLESKRDQVASNPQSRDKFIRRAQELCSESIKAIIKQGHLPYWDALVLGSS